MIMIITCIHSGVTKPFILLHMLGTFDCKEKENSFNDAFQRIVGGLGPKP